MTIIQLEYLLAVANHGSFSRAAQHCFVTQPSLSMQIKALEEELGVTLLDRSRKPVVPTEAGTVVLRNARETLKAYQYIRESVSELKGEVSGLLRLGVIPTIAPYMLHKLLPWVRRKYPKMELEVTETTTAPILEALGRDRLDAAILTAGSVGKGIREHELYNDPFHAYLSPSHPLAGRSNIPLEAIQPRELLLLGEGHCLREQVIELLPPGRKGGAADKLECNSLETLMRIVDATPGAMTILPRMAAEFVPAERNKQLKTLSKGAASRKIIVAVRRTYAKNSLIGALKEAILAVQ